MTEKPRQHLAVFNPPFIDLILSGEKTIESRFSKVRCAPFGVVKTGDIVLMKESGGLVIGEFTVKDVETFRDLNKGSIREISNKYGKSLCAYVSKDFWESRHDARYATLLYVSKPVRYEKPFPFPKKDRRGWMIISGS